MLLVESEWGSALILEAGPSSLCTDGVRWAAWLIDAGFDPTSLDLSDGREVEAALGEAVVLVALLHAVVTSRPLTALLRLIRSANAGVFPISNNE